MTAFADGSGHVVFDVDAKGEDYGRALVKAYKEANEREATAAEGRS